MITILGIGNFSLETNKQAQGNMSNMTELVNPSLHFLVFVIVCVFVNVFVIVIVRSHR